MAPSDAFFKQRKSGDDGHEGKGPDGDAGHGTLGESLIRHGETLVRSFDDEVEWMEEDLNEGENAYYNGRRRENPTEPAEI